MELKKYRDEIDGIDKELTELFCRRMEAAEKVALYKKETGMSIMRAFSKIKTAEAQKMIEETDMNFTQIGEALGFLSLYHFSRFFKEQTGVTLSEYSKEIAKKINSAVFPGLQGGPLMHIIAAKAVAFGEDLQDDFKTYAFDLSEEAVKQTEKWAKEARFRNRN